MPHDPSDKFYRRPAITNGPCTPDGDTCDADLSDEYDLLPPQLPAIFDAHRRRPDACAKLAKDHGAPDIILAPRVIDIRAA